MAASHEGEAGSQGGGSEGDELELLLAAELEREVAGDDAPEAQGAR